MTGQDHNIGDVITVLLIEDNEGDAFLITETLEDCEAATYQVTHEVQLSDGLAALSGQAFDVILSDLTMPDSHGAETYMALLAHTKAPVIVLTGDSNPSIATHALEAGVKRLLVKHDLDALSDSILAVVPGDGGR